MAKPNIATGDTIGIDFSKAFNSLSLFRTGPQLHQDPQPEKKCYSAKFELDCSLEAFFPYINAEIEGARYSGKPEYIKFIYNDHLCILYPQEGAFAPVENHADAVDFLRQLIEFIGDIQRRSDHITPDYRQITSASPLDIFKILPGTNCKECGFNTCLAFAAALSRQYTSHVKCPHLPNPIEERSTYKVVDKQGRYMQTVSLVIDTGDLYRELSEKETQIEELQAQLAAFERSRENNIEANNARLLSPLTRREIEVLEMVAHGATNKEISKNLHISEHTVKSHIIHIFDKLGVNDRAQASVWAAKNGLL